MTSSDSSRIICGASYPTQLVTRLVTLFDLTYQARILLPRPDSLCIIRVEDTFITTRFQMFLCLYPDGTEQKSFIQREALMAQLNMEVTKFHFPSGRAAQLRRGSAQPVVGLQPLVKRELTSQPHSSSGQIGWSFVGINTSDVLLVAEAISLPIKWRNLRNRQHQILFSSKLTMLVSVPRTSFLSTMANNFPQIPEHEPIVHTQATGPVFPTRTGHKSRFLPHIKICPPDVRTQHVPLKNRYLQNEDLDNEVFLSPTSSPTRLVQPFSSDEKHEVHSGRLFLIRHSGDSSGTSTPPSPSRSPSLSPTRSPTWSPSRSPTRTNVSAFSALTSSPLQSPSRSSPSSCPARSVSPASPASRKLPVFVRVYRCNNDHFAIMTRDAVHTGKPLYVNLRHCRVIPGNCLGRFVLAGKCDAGNITEFEVPELSSLARWLDAFQTTTPPGSPCRSGGVTGASSAASSIPKSPALPPLAETDEEN
ncbi:hypothetical protein RRG08_015395 [Elysia crispata]|uniref:Uncharacterized protein n=1 Tax=Elysia crispata TaxID=231223 RepID=A0AAE1ATS4_9GAST|nr:hypothetical protein RRG08_015395 [Elysia crispata]